MRNDAQAPAKEAKCFEKATGTCVKEFSEIPEARHKLDATLAGNKNPCKELPFSVLAEVGCVEYFGAHAHLRSRRVAVDSLEDYAAVFRQQHECRVQELAPYAVPRLGELLDDIGVADQLCTEPVPLTVAGIIEPLLVAAGAGGPDATDILRSINSPGGGQGNATPGGFKPPTMGAAMPCEGSREASSTGPDDPSGSRRDSRCGDPSITPALLVSVKGENDALLRDSSNCRSEVPGEEPETDIDVTFNRRFSDACAWHSRRTAAGAVSARTCASTRCQTSIRRRPRRRRRRQVPRATPAATPAPTPDGDGRVPTATRSGTPGDADGYDRRPTATLDGHDHAHGDADGYAHASRRRRQTPVTPTATPTSTPTSSPRGPRRRTVHADRQRRQERPRERRRATGAPPATPRDADGDADTDSDD